MARPHAIKLTLSDHELAVLDERRGSVTRAEYIRRLLTTASLRLEVARRDEVLAILTELVRDRRVAAAIALEKALRSDGDTDIMRWIKAAPADE
jgi:hypothetical protein